MMPSKYEDYRVRPKPVKIGITGMQARKNVTLALKALELEMGYSRNGEINRLKY